MEKLYTLLVAKYAISTVNVDKALSAGERMMKDYELSLPAGLYKPFSKQVKTMTATKKHIQI